MKKDYNTQANKNDLNLDKATKETAKNANSMKSDLRSYGFYSKVLEKPFDTLAELRCAEDKYYAELRAKENRAATKKADAQKVEHAFAALNKARKEYKENLTAATTKYSADLVALKEAFENKRNAIHEVLATAEKQYSDAIKEFTDKYPEGYHLTLKDGDFETTISGSSTVSDTSEFNFFDWLFSF